MSLLLVISCFAGIAGGANPAHANPVKLTLNASMVHNISGYGDATKLVDEQSTAGDPLAGSGGSPGTQWQPGYATGTYPASVYLDLGQNYNLTNVYYYDANGVGNLTFSSGTSTSSWSSLFTDSTNTYLTWRGHTVSTTARYVKITMEDGGANLREVVLYGTPASSSPPSGNKIALTTAMVHNTSGFGDATLMVDEQSVAGDPKGGSGGAPTTQWVPGGTNYPAEAYLDLGQNYNLSAIYIYDSNGVGNLTVSAGTTVGSWTTLFTDPMNTYLTWSGHNVNVTARYVQFNQANGQSNFREVVLYGSPSSTSTDTTAPAAVTLSAPSATSDSVNLSWTAPGDDGNTGTATSYDIRYSTSSINSGNFGSATPIDNAPVPAAAGTAQSVRVDGLSASTTYYFAMKTKDEVPNTSAMSNVVSKTTTSAPSGCTATIPLNSTIDYYGDGSGGSNHLNVGPGAVVCIEGGTRTALNLHNFHGSAADPIVFINHNGQVTLANTTMGYALNIDNSSYFQLTGTGDANYTYGIRASATKSGVNTVKIGALSTDYEIDHMEVYGAGFAGMNLKTDPTCDLSGNRDHFVQYNTSIHDNYVHNTTGEGFYIGYTFYNGHDISCQKVVNGVPQVDQNGNPIMEDKWVLPHVIEGLRVFNNVTNQTGRDGIQVSSAVSDVLVYNNTITNFATANEDGQTAGIQINPGSTGRYYNNRISGGNTKGKGFEVQAWGDTYIYNNLIVNPGSLGFYTKDERSNTSDPLYNDHRGYHILNNTIVGPTTRGITYSNTALTGSNFDNNIVISASGSYYSGTGLSQSNGLYATSAGTSIFVNAASGDYHLKAGSAAIDAGLNTSSSGVVDDIEGDSRPNGSAYDIGAYEY